MTSPESVPDNLRSIFNHQGTEDDVHYLRSLLGDAFVDWVLANEGDSFTAAQVETAGVLASFMHMYSSGRPELPAAFAASSLCFYYEPARTTFLNHCRNHAGGEKEIVNGSSGDRLLSALLAFAEECYGEMLLPTYLGMHGPYFHHHIKTEAGQNLVNAIYDEQIFPGSPEIDIHVPAHGAEFMYSFPGMHASNLIWSAWNHAKLEAGTPTLDQLADKIPTVLDQHRSLASGGTAMVTAIASLTGVRLPDDVQISGAWGRIRPARVGDHPSSVRAFIDQRTTTTTDNGDKVEISDAGDVIFETTIPMQVRINDEGWAFNRQEDFEEKINKICLALALAVERSSRPIIFAVWSTILIPIASLEPLPLTNPQFMAARMPTLLTPEEIISWQRWINITMSVDMSHLTVAMTRTLRAMTERRDPGDRLIDAVIAWESLFGGRPETTLRVSASLARLLHPPVVQERETARQYYAKIYDARSSIVHAGKKIPAAQLDEYGRKAIDTSLKVIAMLLTTHTSLRHLGSDSRSKQILLGADNPPRSSNEAGGAHETAP